MGSVLQFAAFLSICWLIRGVVTHPNQNEDKKLNNKHSNQTATGDFYFDEQKANDDDNVKTGRAVPQSAWSKEDKEQTQPFENKTGAQFSDEFSFKNTLSYLLSMLHELKKDIFGIKEMTSLKNTKDLTNSQDNSEDKVKQNKMGENNDTPKSDASIKNTEFEKKNQKPKSNYIIDYYQNNDIKFVDDDLETSSDESDDSSHKPNEGASMHEISKNKDNACISDCSEIKRKPNRYSSEAEETTASQTKIPEESDKEFDDTKDYEKDDDFKESTTKPSKMKQNNSKTSREETENTPSSKTGKCMKKNNDNSNNLNEKNEPTEKPLKFAEILTTRSPQNENFNKAKSERSNQNKTTDNLSKVSSSSPDSRSSGKNSQNKGGSDFYSKSGVLSQSTTLSSQSSKDAIYPDNIEKKPYASGMSSEKPTYKKQQEHITSLKPEEQEQAQNNAKSSKNNDRATEYTTVSLPSQEAGSEIANHGMSTDTVIEDSLKEYKGKRLNVNSAHTTGIYSENESNSKTDGQQIPNTFDTGNTISPTTSGNIINTDNLDEDPSDNLNGKKGTNKNEKSNTTQQGEKDSETQKDSESEQTKTQQLNDNSEPEKSLKNNKLNDSNRENNYKEEDDNLASMTTNDLPFPQDPNRAIHNHDVEGSDKPQEETQKNNESQNKKDEMRETSPDQEYEYEEDNEDFDISDELTDIEMDGDFNQNQEGELIENNRNEENNDEMNPGNTATVLRNESQISQHTGYVMEEKSQEQYNTFLEYFYKHSNNPLFQSLKNQSNNLSR